MNRDNSKLQARQAYVKKYIENYKGFTKDAVNELSESLFLSDKTIWKDLKADTTDEK